MNFCLLLLLFFFFLTRNTNRKTPQQHKRLIWKWKYVRGINHVIYKKKRKKNLKIKFFFFNKENSTAPLKAAVKVEICWRNKQCDL